MSENSEDYCRVFWGSHGCDLPRGHSGEVHRCGPIGDAHSEATTAANIPRVRYRYDDEATWSEWALGNLYGDDVPTDLRADRRPGSA